MPMLTLILETSSEKGCLVLADGEQPLRSQLLAGGPDLSRTLAMYVKALLAGTIPVLIALGIGPGSYTGIRVGAALAKALSFGWKIPLLGFCSLRAFGPPPVLVDARTGGFYALLEGKASLVSPSDPRLQPLSLIRSPHPDLIKKRLVSKAFFQEMSPNPDGLAKLVWEQFQREGATPFALEYLTCP